MHYSFHDFIIILHLFYNDILNPKKACADFLDLEVYYEINFLSESQIY